MEDHEAIMTKPSDRITGSISNDRSSRCCSKGEGEKCCYPPTASNQLTQSKEWMELSMLRMNAFGRHVLSPLRIKLGVATQMYVLQKCMDRRRCLYMSIAELLQSGQSDMWSRSNKQLADCFDDLVRRGYMVRASRDAIKGNGKVVIWGLTGKGKALLREYYDWIGGKHDSKIGF